jgi:hypothetical protein
VNYKTPTFVLLPEKRFVKLKIITPGLYVFFMAAIADDGKMTRYN